MHIPCVRFNLCKRFSLAPKLSLRLVQPTDLQFVNSPSDKSDETYALSEALHAIDAVLELHCIVTYTSWSYAARLAVEECPRAVAITPHYRVYHRLNLVWGIKPVLTDEEVETFEDVVQQVDTNLTRHNFATVAIACLLWVASLWESLAATIFSKFTRSTVDITPAFVLLGDTNCHREVVTRLAKAVIQQSNLGLFQDTDTH